MWFCAIWETEEMAEESNNLSLAHCPSVWSNSGKDQRQVKLQCLTQTGVYLMLSILCVFLCKKCV